MTTQVAIMEHTHLDFVDNKSTKLKTAVMAATRKERQNQATKKRKDWLLINKIKAKDVEQQFNIASLKEKVVHSKRSAKN